MLMIHVYMYTIPYWLFDQQINSEYFNQIKLNMELIIILKIPIIFGWWIENLLSCHDDLGEITHQIKFEKANEYLCNRE